ncbi:glycosyltransferase [Haliangium ochraceum]|uniref:UDP-glucuronosyl/UDP-glucosyltransferase n=1 Tax=Haliangium ochraceum (strain DSM 14365 / JCM 11303 / SMP-2) TaxID=502025 RepID=D0LTF5_HALO1|nr:glycosyltransferase [Haliangium ochraceum]ACY13850.1 UDP-glucuronosyl/UDP-glucosyltransferase [Haliangium ochraceum DSM 14365]
MAKLCFVPWPEWGHVMPPLRLANDLIQRGHRVSMIVPPGYGERVASAGVEPVWWRDPRFAQAHAMTRNAADTAAFEAGDRLLTECVAADTEGETLRALLEAGGYDLVFADELVPATVVVAWSLGIPCVQTADGLPVDCLPPGPDLDERVREAAALEATFLHDYFEKNPAFASFDEFVERAGYRREWIDEDDPCAGVKMTTTLGKTLLFCPPTLAPAPHVGERYHFCQSLPRPDGRNHAPRAGSARTVCLSFGNYAARYPEGVRVASCLIEAMARVPDMHMRVLAFPPPLAECLPQARNVEFVGFVDQRALLHDGVRLMCTHGGLGSFKECAYTGTPVFVTPFWVDQPRNAATVEHLGMGAHVALDASDTEVRETFARALSSGEMLARAADVSERVHAFERQSSGADVVENLLRDIGA